VARPPDQQLTRTIGLVQATAMVVGTIIGASIFVQPSIMTSAVPSARGVLMVWGVAGILTLFGSLIAAELASAFPRTGGVYVFLREAFSPSVAFLWGWAMFWTMHSGIIAVIAVVLARYAAFFVPMGDVALSLVAMAAIVLISAINYVGVRQGSAVQTAFTIGKVVAVAVIIVVGLASHPRPATPLGAAQAAATAAMAGMLGDASFSDFVLALIAGLFAFGGWHMVTYAAEETIEPERTIPRALTIGTLIVTAAYIAMNAVYLHLLPIGTMIGSQRVAADAADAVLGSGGAAVMSGLVVFSTFGALSGIILSGPRVYLSMAQDGILFSWFGNVHPRFRTPHRAIVVQAVWSCVLVFFWKYRDLFMRVVFTEWIFFALMAVGLVLLRRRPGYAPRYRVWGYPVVPVVFALSSLAIVVNQLITRPLPSLTALLFVGVGWPIHLLTVRPRAGGRRKRVAKRR
jgi:APA family basic amino acid/polyamine antiporter